MLLILFTLFSSLADARTKIAILDTGLKKGLLTEYLCEDWEQDQTGTGIDDLQGHGTNIAGIISRYLDPQEQCLIIIKVFNNKGKFEDANEYISGLIKAVTLGAKYINLSLSGGAPIELEKKLLSIALELNNFVIVAAGNNNRDLDKSCNNYPACYGFSSPHFFIVGSKSYKEVKSPFSNYGKDVIFDYGEKQCFNGWCTSGTSQATANFTGRLVKIYEQRKNTKSNSHIKRKRQRPSENTGTFNIHSMFRDLNTISR